MRSLLNPRDTPSKSSTRPGRLACLALIGLTAVVACSEGPAAPASTGGDNATPPSQPPPYDHTLGPGASASDLLSADDFDSLVVEINYTPGHQPSDEGLEGLSDFIAARLNKPAGIEIRVGQALPTPAQSTYTVAEVRALEEQHRTAYTEGRTIAIHFLFLGGEFAEQSNVLGFAYNNTSMAIFEQKIQDNSGGISQPSTATVETVVLNHELGHILGLVNNGSAMQTEHQDEPNGRHCDDPDCLMYYAVRTTDFISNLLGGMPTLDQDCLDDLQANGGR